jgi:hypothetical protein
MVSDEPAVNIVPDIPFALSRSSTIILLPEVGYFAEIPLAINGCASSDRNSFFSDMTFAVLSLDCCFPLSGLAFLR